MLGPILLAQAPIPSAAPADWLQWMYLWGEPAVTLARWWGGFLTWSKVVGLYCLLAWVVSWLYRSLRSDKPGGRTSPVAPATFLAVLVTGMLAALLGALDDTGRLRLAAIGGLKPATWLGIVSGGLLLALVEFQLWSAILKREASADLVCLVAMHAAIALGYFIAYRWNSAVLAFVKANNIPVEQAGTMDWRVLGGRIAATYMGLVALARVAWLLGTEVALLRWRRLYSIAWQSVVEANRSNRAPWVVVGVFAVVLAFTHWFIRGSGERDAELSKMFVGTLTLLCSLLISVMVGFIAPRSMPRDISSQTIYTVVSKPVRRLELIWGRLLGYMFLVTVLLAIFGGVSMLYLYRTIGYRISEARAQAREIAATKPDIAKQLEAQAEQLETRMSARVPVRGSLVFQDAKRKDHRRGIDVGQEQETRSFVEGATESRAVWKFGQFQDPYDPRRMIDTSVPVDKLLVPGTIEAVENRILNLKDEQGLLDRQREASGGNLKGSDASKLTAGSQARAAEIARLEDELSALKKQEQGLRAAARTLKGSERVAKTQEADGLHSPPIPVEMTFTVYRTTKGILGEPVLASITATGRPGVRPFSTLVPIREYYTNKKSLPSSVLVGSHGQMTVSVRCVTANQYLGMAEGDLYLLASEGGFYVNFLKGLFGIWLQVMVLAAIGLFAGTFLSWPVALLTTVAFFVAGQVAFSFLANFAFAVQDATAMGPFESLIRLISHQNLQNALSPTPAVILAKTSDAIVLPVMSRLVYLIPNFNALDVTNTVADGFAVTWPQILQLTLMGLGYSLPFTVAGYFILKNREVAA